MSNVTITNNDFGSYQLDGGGDFNNETLVFVGTETILKGTLLGRITATGKLAVYDGGNGDGTEIPVAICPSDLTKGSAGDLSMRAQVAGKVLKDRLIIAADGDASNINKGVQDQLRNVGIVSFDSDQNLNYDNPQ